MALFDSLGEIRQRQKQLRRRRFLTISLAGVACYGGYRWWRQRAKPLIQRITQFVTPRGAFFTTSINPAFRPGIEPDSYRLIIEREGGGQSRFSLQTIRSLPSERVWRTLICVGNSVGGPAIGNAEWTVTRLAPLLEPLVSGSRETALHVVFHGLDGFDSSVPLEIAMEPESVLAYEMDGEDLPRKHGFPLRVLLPDRYGMKQPRWLERIVITESDESGYWERRGWSDSCLIQLTSRIDSAKPAQRGGWLVTGVAFCGARPVGLVEVSCDDGQTWTPARLTQDPLPNCWSPWELEWTPRETGDHILSVRVTDSEGNRQSEDYSGSFPSGATGLHRVVVVVG